MIKKILFVFIIIFLLILAQKTYATCSIDPHEKDYLFIKYRYGGVSCSAPPRGNDTYTSQSSQYKEYYLKLFNSEIPLLEYDCYQNTLDSATTSNECHTTFFNSKIKFGTNEAHAIIYTLIGVFVIFSVFLFYKKYKKSEMIRSKELEKTKKD